MTQHDVATACERGWSQLKNGELLDAAETDGFAILVTSDSNLKYQQNLAGRRIAIIVLGTTSWPRIQTALDKVVRAIDGASAGTCTEVDF